MRTAFILSLAFVNIILAAHVMLYMWGQFAVPLGAPAINAPQAYGILLILQAPSLASGISTAVTLNRLVPKAERDESMITSALSQTFGWLMFAGFAYIAARYV